MSAQPTLSVRKGVQGIPIDSDWSKIRWREIELTNYTVIVKTNVMAKLFHICVQSIITLHKPEGRGKKER